MSDVKNLNLDYDQPIQISDGIYWVGFYDRASKLHCNPYLIVDDDEALLIDGGSRPDFPNVMMKILKTGINPQQIKTLIYHHYDPDLCGNIPNLEDIIDNKNLKIISEFNNLIFIRHYAVSSPMVTIDSLKFSFEFSSGRKLEFYKTPYAHSAGSFITLDTKTKTLFTSDLFGSYASEWDLFLTLDEKCAECDNNGKDGNCPNNTSYCPLPDILKFHEMVMPSEKALKNAVSVIRSLDFDIIAPQHGSVINNPKDAKILLDKIESLEDVGIDGIVKEQDCSGNSEPTTGV